jgi:hypothetical protein
MCAAIDAAFEAQFGAQLRALAEAYVVSALGDLGGYVGAECGACEAGDCSGLACDPETL